jgi:VWFA-related protein
VRLIASVVGLALALAGQPVPQQSVQRFKSSVDIVQVDVSAVDNRGNPIPDLTANDFELKVDGRRRKIVAIQFVSVPADPRRTDTPPPTHYASNADAGRGRLIMVAVDRASIATGRGKAVLEAASRFVGGLNPADRVALATIPDGPQVAFTADHSLVRRLLLQIEGTAIARFGNRNIGIADALAFERRDTTAMQLITERECGAANVGGNQRSGSSDVFICQGEVKSEALLVAADARERTRRSVTGLQALLDGFPPSQTPKMLVYISEGLVTQGQPTPLSWLDAQAAAAHVTIYPLHLQASELDASERRPPANATADRSIREHGLAMLAESTGGELFRIVANSDFPFQRLSAELSGYYLLGFEPDAGDRNGRPHDIGVRVLRRGVTVRSRRQFTISATAATTTDDEIVATLRDPLPAAEIPLKLTTYAFRDPRDAKLRLFLAAEIDRAINPEGDFSVAYIVVDFDGKLIASQKDAALPPPPLDQKRTQRYFSYTAVSPGKYTVKLVVVDDAGRRGSVEHVADARLIEAKTIRATDLLLGEGGDPGWALPVAPTVTGDFSRNVLYGYMELFADARETLADANVTLEIAPLDSSAVLARIPVQLSTPDDGERSRVASIRVDLTPFPAGSYMARAVIGVGLDAVGEARRPFRIVR